MRGYQPHFIAHSKAVRDPDSRRQKAEKIIHALTSYSNRSLGSAVCLDVGSSSGLIASQLAEHCREMLGLEYDELALEQVDPAARERVQFIRGDAMSLPFRDQSVDVVICAQVYEHVPDAERLIQEINRVLEPGGTVFFSGPNWLFPVEPHYYLPFLHWLPGPMADLYLRLTGKGDHYYEELRSLWDLRQLVAPFVIHDITLEVMHLLHRHQSRATQFVIRLVPTWLWRFLLPVFPNYNWILYKPPA
jgi:ubiquinone/menaquinone biosynthesis C-methylase UbiE